MRRHLVALAALVVAFIGVTTHQAIVAIPALACLVIYLGTLPCRPAERLHRLGDPSYGMYLSGFVIQQFLVWVGLVQVHQPWLSFVEGAVLATAFGYASWHLVEKRAMRLVKPRASEPAPPMSAPGPDEPSAGVVEAVEEMAHPLPLGA